MQKVVIIGLDDTRISNAIKNTCIKYDIPTESKPCETDLSSGIFDKNKVEVCQNMIVRLDWIDEDNKNRVSDFKVHFKFGMFCIDVSYTGNAQDHEDFISLHEAVIYGEYYVVQE